GCPLINRQLCDLVGDLRCDLKAAGAGADEGEPRSSEIDRRVPLGGMKGRSCERLGAIDVGQSRGVERTDCTDHKLCIEVFDTAVGVGDRQGPPRSSFVEFGGINPRAKTAMGSKTMRGQSPFEVAAQFGVLRKV